MLFRLLTARGKIFVKWNYCRSAITEHMLQIMFRSTFCEIILRWMPQQTFDGKSIYVQVMARCRQATSHYLSQCWPRYMLPYGIIRPQWVEAKFCCLFGTKPLHIAMLTFSEFFFYRYIIICFQENTCPLSVHNVWLAKFVQVFNIIPN